MSRRLPTCSSELESFNQPISGWNVDKVTSMTDMFRGAKAFDQDLGWCLSGDVKMTAAFEKTKCESTRCGFSYKDVIGNCERLSPPCLIYAARPWSARKDAESTHQLSPSCWPISDCLHLLQAQNGTSTGGRRRTKLTSSPPAASSAAAAARARWNQVV